MQITGGHAVVQTLIALGARRGFGVPGESYLDVLDGFYDAKSFEFTCCRNEGGAAFMAEAWAKLTGEVGLCFVTRGPGATNASIGVHTAQQASTPMILFVGQVGLEHQGREAFQEVDYVQMFAPLAKWVVEIRDAARCKEIITRAWSIALSGRPGPVVISLPEDMLRQVADFTAPKSYIMPPATAPAAQDISKVVASLSQAKRPVLLVGGGGWHPTDRAALAQCAETLGVPVITAFRFHDLFDNHNPLYCGEAGVGMTANTRRILAEADCIVAANVRFGEMTTDAYTLFNGGQWIAHIHKSADEFHKVVDPDVKIVSDPGAFFTQLEEHMQVSSSRPDNGWVVSAREGYVGSQVAKQQPGNVDLGLITQHVQGQLSADAIVTNGAGNFAIWPNKFMRFGPDQRLLAPQSGAMGYGVPAAIAAKIEHPERQVICFAGDGDFQMNCQELGTAMQAGVGPVILIVNNGTYGTIRMHQERTYPERVSGTDIVNPDFAALAKSYGFYGECITETAAFPAAWQRALSHKQGAVLELCVEQQAITPGQTIDDLRRAAKA